MTNGEVRCLLFPEDGIEESKSCCFQEMQGEFKKQNCIGNQLQGSGDGWSI